MCSPVWCDYELISKLGVSVGIIINWKSCLLVYEVSCFWKLDGPTAWTTSKKNSSHTSNVFFLMCSPVWLDYELISKLGVSVGIIINWKSCLLVYEVSCFWKLDGPTAWTTSKKIVHALECMHSFNVFQVGVSKLAWCLRWHH